MVRTKKNLLKLLRRMYFYTSISTCFLFPIQFCLQIMTYFLIVSKKLGFEVVVFGHIMVIWETQNLFQSLFFVVFWAIKMCLFTSVLWTAETLFLLLVMDIVSHFSVETYSSHGYNHHIQLKIFIIFVPLLRTVCSENNICIIYLLGHVFVVLLILCMY